MKNILEGAFFTACVTMALPVLADGTLTTADGRTCMIGAAGFVYGCSGGGPPASPGSRNTVIHSADGRTCNMTADGFIFGCNGGAPPEARRPPTDVPNGGQRDNQNQPQFIQSAPPRAAESQMTTVSGQELLRAYQRAFNEQQQKISEQQKEEQEQETQRTQEIGRRWYEAQRRENEDALARAGRCTPGQVILATMKQVRMAGSGLTTIGQVCPQNGVLDNNIKAQDLCDHPVGYTPGVVCMLVTIPNDPKQRTGRGHRSDVAVLPDTVSGQPNGQPR